MSLVGSLMALTHSLTHSILINLFIKLELSKFLLPPLLSIVKSVQSSWGRFDEERLERRKFPWRALEGVCWAPQRLKSAIMVFMWFFFVNMFFFDCRLVEVFMTVMMYRSQLHGRGGQRIDTRKPESGIMLTWAVTYIGENRKLKLVAFPLGKRIWWFSLTFSPGGVQGKLKFLLSFGFTVSLRFYFVYTHWNSACVSIWRKFEICKLILKYFK